MKILSISILVILLILISSSQPTHHRLLQTCDANCILCNSNKTCQICREYYGIVLNNLISTCQKCPPNCQDCYQNNCTTCSDFYGIVTLFDNLTQITKKVCQKCPLNCQKCFQNICNNCLKNYGIVTTNNTKQCKICPVYCSYCSQNKCTTCQNLYGVSFYGYECQKCSPNCISCSKSTQCSTCAAMYGLFKDDISLICIQCPQYCLSCLNDSCTSCIKGYELIIFNETQKKICSLCTQDIFCEQCSNKTCKRCSQKYGILTQSGAKTCRLCIVQNCKSCLQNNCSSCLPSYELVKQSQKSSKMICKKCPDNCLECNNSICKRCLDNTTFSDNGCVSRKCPENCWRCFENVCQACNQGYLLSSGNCEKCIEGCSNCGLISSCNYCFDRYFLDSNKSCAKCPQNCIKCRQANDCILCDSNFLKKTINNTGILQTKCQKCSQGFPNCQNCSSDACFICSSGYGLVKQANTTNFFCQKCPSNCLFCDNNICQKCIDGFGSNTMASSIILECKRCPTNCVYCKYSSQCLKCKNEYILDNNQQCKLCENANCLNCAKSGKCFQCKKDFSPNLQNSQCIANERRLCINNSTISCQSCTNLNILNNIYANSKGQCFKCKDEFCVACDMQNPNLCTTCMKNNYWNEGTQKCQACPQGCKSCNKTGCLDCDDGFALSQSVCKACSVKSCSVCSSNSLLCDLCRPGTQFNNQTKLCQITKTPNNCQIGCSQCFQTDPRQCLSCQKGYFYDNLNNTCRRCQSNCYECIKLGVCKTCIPFYTLSSNNTCVQCPKNCSKCNTNQCLECQHNFLLFNLSCLKSIDDGCSFKKSSGCIICKNGYAVNQAGNCVRCSANCKYSCNPLNITQCKRIKYIFDPKFDLDNLYQLQGCNLTINNQCYSPLPGYNLQQVNQRYIAKYSCLRPCQTCNQSKPGVCLTCIDGYILQNQKCIPNTSCNPNCSACPTFQTFREASSKNCVSCTIENCGSCFNGECLQCREGYYYDKDAKLCKVCQSNCKLCISKEICKVCAKGYYAPQKIQPSPLEICRACSENCLTCFRYESTCTSCRDGFKLENTQCVGAFKVAFRYKLNNDYDNFLKNFGSQDLISEIARILKKDSRTIKIRSIAKGSTIVNGEVEANNESNAKDMTKTLQSTQLKNFVVMESQINPTKNGEVITDAKTEQESSGVFGLSKGAIAGIAIGAGVFVIGLIVLIVCLVKRSKKQHETAGDNFASAQNLNYGK